MGFVTKNQNLPHSAAVVKESNSENKLNQNELALLLEMIKQTTFLGENVELVYTTAMKLQKQFIEQTNK